MNLKEIRKEIYDYLASEGFVVNKERHAKLKELILKFDDAALAFLQTENENQKKSIEEKTKRIKELEEKIQKNSLNKPRFVRKDNIRTWFPK